MPTSMRPKINKSGLQYCHLRVSGSIVRLIEVVCPPERRRVIKVG